MSKNHPNDNIYSILDKLDALKPTPQEQHDAAVKQIYETVESQGSILKGLREVSDVEQRLAQQFAESKVEKDHCSKCDCDPCECEEKLDESKCNECGMYESKCSCDHTNEDTSRAAKGYEKYGKKGMQALAKAGREGAGEKKLDKIRDQHDQYNEGEVEPTKHGIRHHAKPGVYGGYNPETDPDKDDVETKPSAEKKGRGRPTKASTGEKTSQERMPWGGKPPKDTYKHQKGSFVHKIAEGVNFKQMDEETRRNLDELLQELQNDVSQYKATGHCSETLKDFLTVHQHGKSQKLAQEAEQAPAPAPVNPHPVGSSLPASQIPGKEALLKGQGRNYYEEVDPLEEELAALAELAGITRVADEGAGVMHFKKQQAEKSGKDSFELGGKEFPVDESDMEEGNEFSGNLAKAKAQHQDSFEVDGKEYPVKEAEAPVSEPKAKPVNAPKEKYFGIKDQLGTMNTGEADSGEKNNYGGRGDNPMKQQPNRPARPVRVGEAATGQLEARLAAEYESIKKVS